MRMASPPRIEFRSSMRALLFNSGGGWIVLAAMVIAVAAGSFAGYWWQTLSGVAAIALIFGGYQYLRFRTATFGLDEERLIMCRGILMRTEEEIELYRIKDVKVGFSIIQQMFGTGTITINSSDASGTISGAGGHVPRTAISVAHVLDARLIREEIRNRVEAARQRRGVRELDIS
ncbi:MAG: PH domain-containing protein [Blastomonas sp.]